MKYSLDSPYMPYLIDEYKTSCEDDECSEPECAACGGVVRNGESCYDVDGAIYCMRCSEAADEAILELVRDRYICEP